MCVSRQSLSLPIRVLCFLLAAALGAAQRLAAAAGGALQCDGVNDQVTVPDTGDFDFATTMTLEGWVRYDSFPNEGSGTVVGGFSPPDASHFTLGTDQGIPVALISVGTILTNSAKGPTMATGSWTHLAGTYDGATLRIYVNGTLAGTAPQTGNVADVTELRLCRYPRNIDNFLHGAVDEVRVWNIARTAQQIHDNYLQALEGTEPGLVAYYRFDEGTGQVVVDSSNAGNDGFLGTSSTAGTDDPERVASGAPLAEPGPCVRDANTACLLDDRFEVRVTMKDFSTPAVVFPGVIQTYSGASSETNQTVSFYSFQEGNVEVFVKMVDACTHATTAFWLFAAGATDADTEITVRDSLADEIYTIHNLPHVVFDTVADTQAFKTCAF